MQIHTKNTRQWVGETIPNWEMKKLSLVTGGASNNAISLTHGLIIFICLTNFRKQ